jgi:hypothetical protein
VSSLNPPCAFSCVPAIFCVITSFFPGSCLNPVDEDHRIYERIEALERVPSDTNTFWVDPRCHSAIVLLQDCAQHIGESVDRCQKSLTTMFSVMLPWNPPPENFGQLLGVFHDKPTCSLPNRAQFGGWRQLCSWLDT